MIWTVVAIGFHSARSHELQWWKVTWLVGSRDIGTMDLKRTFHGNFPKHHHPGGNPACWPGTHWDVNSVGFHGMSLVDVTAPCLTSSIGTRAQQLAQKELGGWYPAKYFVTHWPVEISARFALSPIQPCPNSMNSWVITFGWLVTLPTLKSTWYSLYMAEKIKTIHTRLSCSVVCFQLCVSDLVRFPFPMAAAMLGFDCHPWHCGCQGVRWSGKTETFRNSWLRIAREMGWQCKARCLRLRTVMSEVFQLCFSFSETYFCNVHFQHESF